MLVYNALSLLVLKSLVTIIVTEGQKWDGKNAELTGSVREGARSVLEHFGLFVRCSTLGSVVGMIPGVGGTVASFLAYGHAVQTAGGSRASFGHGNIRGVLAPEAANDAKDGGSLIPTLAFGIPGSPGTVLLLATLTLHGIIPGRELMTDQLGLVFALIWSLAISNWLTSIVGLSLVGHLARLTLIRTQLLVPLILLFALLGAFAYQGRIQDVLVAVLFGIAGFYMKKYGWPRIALVLALVLGPLFETNFHMTVRLQELGRINVLTRPLSILLVVLIVLSLVVPVWKNRASEAS